MNESTQNLPSTRKEPLAGCREVIVPGSRCSLPVQHGCSHIWASSGKWACGDLWDPTRVPPISGRSPFEWSLQVITVIYSLCFCWDLNRGSLFNSGVLKCHMLLAEITWTFPWFIRIWIVFFQSHHAGNTINTVSFLKAWNWCVLWKKRSTIYNSGYELRLSLEIELGSSFCCLPFTYPVTLGDCLISLRFNFLIYK